MNRTPSTDEIVSKLDHRLDSIVGANEILLQRRYGLGALVPAYIEAFPRIRNAPGRIHILFWLTRFARENAVIVDLARSALRDRSRVVRNYACGILAYAGTEEALPDLQVLLSHPNQATCDDARAAINAIQKGNHHLFADRTDSGNVHWEVGRTTS